MNLWFQIPQSAALVATLAAECASTAAFASPLAESLEAIRARHHLPALACTVIRSNSVVDQAAVGLRAEGRTNAVTLQDAWHLGSVTKSMTATLAAVLVDEGRLHWTDRLGDAFPTDLLSVDPAWRDVTLEQLLGNRGGAPDQAWLDQSGLWSQFWNTQGTPRDQRLFLAREILKRPPSIPPGTRFVYSNAGFILAGVWMEQRLGLAWESLVAERVFRPLGMTSAGFGPPDPAGTGSQPWGHRKVGSSWVALPPGPQADNPSGLGPAGTVHASMSDLSNFVMAHLNGELGRSTPLKLKPETWHRLHTALEGQAYALGWNITSRPWAGGTAWNHTGSNTYWFCNVWVAPKMEFAVLVFTNAGGDDAFKATDEVAAAVIQQRLTQNAAVERLKR